MSDRPDSAVNRVAKAIKAEIGRQWGATQLPSPSHPEDWSASGGGNLDLELVAQAAIEAHHEWMQDTLKSLVMDNDGVVIERKPEH